LPLFTPLSSALCTVLFLAASLLSFDAWVSFSSFFFVSLFSLHYSGFILLLLYLSFRQHRLKLPTLFSSFLFLDDSSRGWAFGNESTASRLNPTQYAPVLCLVPLTYESRCIHVLKSFHHVDSNTIIHYNHHLVHHKPPRQKDKPMANKNLTSAKGGSSFLQDEFVPLVASQWVHTVAGRQLQTDRRTDGRTDRPQSRRARDLKRLSHHPLVEISPPPPFPYLRNESSPKRKYQDYY